MVRTLEVECARGQNVTVDEIMDKDMDKRLKPGTITMPSLSQELHSDELSDRLFDIIGNIFTGSRKNDASMASMFDQL
jgi:hypothetical protein